MSSLVIIAATIFRCRADKQTCR